MALLAAEIKYYKSTSVSDAAGNGGRLSANEITDNVKNNVWPDAPSTERVAGSTKYRKVFIAFKNAARTGAVTPKVFMEDKTTGDDRQAFFAGTQTDVQSDISSPRLYGAGRLNANVSAGATSITIAVEAAGDALFLNGDTIRISDKEYLDSVSGNEEYVTATGAASYAGNVATIAVTALVNSYVAATPTKVSSVYKPTSPVVPTCSTPVVTSTAGTYNNGTYPPLTGGVGGVRDDWTITFTSATAYTASGANTGSVGTGSRSADFSPNNPDFSAPYFTLPTLAFGGTYLSGDTITFTTTPSCIPIWYKRLIPAAAASVSNNLVTLSVDTESA